MNADAAIQHRASEAPEIPTAALVERLFHLADNISEDARRMAAISLLDWIAVTLPGARDEMVDKLVADAIEEGEGRATLVGRKERVRAIDAALVNGAASHVLDYDDGLRPMMGHPSVAVIPALLALAEQKKVSGRDFVTAHVLAVEAAACIGLLATPEHYARGFHATATFGAMGAAAGCAYLLGLDRKGMATAMGMAGVRAAGLKAAFGTHMKSIRVAWANVVGLSSARWAARGLTGPADILGDSRGFVRTHSSNFAIDEMLAAVPVGGAHIRYSRFKRYSACAGTHASIDAYVNLAATAPFAANDIDKVEVQAFAGADSICNIPSPTTGLEAKFSLRATVAMAILGIDPGNPENFTAATVTSPEFIAMRERIRVKTFQDWEIGEAKLAIRLKDGREYLGAYNDLEELEPVDVIEAQIRAKFTSIASSWNGEGSGARILDEVLRLDEVKDMADFMALLRP